MSYPGNSSLGDEVKQRITTTYEQSVELAERGREQEAILGCEFILELDPQFEPARALKDRLSDGGEAAASPAPAPAPAASGSPGAAGPSAEEPLDLSSLDNLDLPEPPPPQPTPQEGVGAPGGAPTGLAATLRERLEARDFQGVLDEAGRHQAAIQAEPELAAVVDAAQSRLEAQPYVENFLKEAGMLLRADEPARARGVLAKVRSLDPDHPRLADLEAQLASSAASGPGATDAAAQEPPPAPPQAEPSRPTPAPESGPEAAPSGDPGPAPPSAPEPAPAPEPGGDGPGDAGPDDPFGGMELAELSLGEESPLVDQPAATEDGSASAAGSSAPEASAPPSAGGGSDDRIAELLAEGQQAADRGELQEAIDAWSRIFLIDVDHDEAARRIEDARRIKAERERAVEEIFHEGLSSLESGDRETARERFEQVLERQPNHLAAKDYLQQIDSGKPVEVASRRPGPDETAAMGELGSFDLSGLDSQGAEDPSEDLKEEILVPPSPGEKADRDEQEKSSSALPSYGKSVVSRGPGVRAFVVIGGLVLVLVLAAGWFVYTNKERFFPNSAPQQAPAGEAAAQEAGPGPVDRARALHERGQTAMALGLLRRIRPDHPRHDEAQELIAQWDAPDEGTEGSDEEDALSPELEARHGRLLEAARSAFGTQEHLLASELYQRAAEIASLEGDDAERFETAQRELEPLAREVELFLQGEYEMVLPSLWRLHEEQPGNRDVRRMLVTSYYNRGVRQLQRGDATSAATEFEEALSLAPDDRNLQRLYLFAQTYERRPRDLLYRIYVKHLPVR